MPPYAPTPAIAHILALEEALEAIAQARGIGGGFDPYRGDRRFLGHSGRCPTTGYHGADSPGGLSPRLGKGRDERIRAGGTGEERE